MYAIRSYYGQQPFPGVVGGQLALEACTHLGVGREMLRQHLDRDVAAEAGVGGTEHLAHAARAERSGDLVRAEAGAGSEWHRANLH